MDENSLEVLYNSNAYSRRLDALVASQLLAAPATDPVSVKRAQLPPLNQQRQDALESYFKERLRKVPFSEAPFGSDGGVDVPPTAPPNTYVQGSGDTLRPIEDWSLPTAAGSATVGTLNGPTQLNLLPDQPPATNPREITPADNERELGDRLVIGNNLPALRWDGNRFRSDKQDVDNATEWTTGGGRRFRTPQVTKLAEVGSTDRGNGLGEKPTPGNPFRDGFWERTAAQIPINPLEGTGGLRVITSAGVYDRTNSFLPPPSWINVTTGLQVTGPASTNLGFPAANTYDDPATPVATEQYRVVWPDSMPMSPLGPGSQVYNNTTVGPNPGDWTPWLPAWSSANDISVDLPDAEDSTTLLPGIIEAAATARKFAKGDLRMRASAVYHYANDGFDATALAAAPAGTQPDQKPLACVSSYYDPSNASTARNISTGGLPNVSGETGLGAPQAFIGSNNGVTYGRPERPRPAESDLDPDTGLLSGGDPVLDAQANLVFPDGRFANGPLRTALQLPEKDRTLAQKAAIDSTNCAIEILNGSLVPNSALIPHGAIQEVAFLNGREVKAIERDNPTTTVNEAFTLSRPLADPPLTTDYNQPLEEREPLEIRATQLDIRALRGEDIAGTEWLLPNSGIIYASRDDALPDRSDRSLDPATGLIDQSRSKRVSPSDYQLDPTRKPNGIVLINGDNLFRGTGNQPIRPNSVIDVVREKGLTLVSNLPVYIKGMFNLHGRIPPNTPNFTQLEEFDPGLQDNVLFYNRTTLDPNFACRAGDPRLPNCDDGDYWRPATVLADAVTLLSQNYRFGFRNEGDFDLRNNAGAAAVLRRRQQGFFNNNFVTNGLSSGAFLATGNSKPQADPITVTDATYVNANAQPLWSSYFNNFVTPVQRRGLFPEYVMEVCTRLPVSECTDGDWYVNPAAATIQPSFGKATVGDNYTPAAYPAGTTAIPPAPELQRFPRRVAFQRTYTPAPPDPPTTFALTDLDDPQPLGIDNNTGNIVAGVGRSTANALWFAADNGANVVAYDATNPPYLVNPRTTPLGTTDGSRVPLPILATESTPLPLPAVTVPPATYNYNGSQPLLVPVPQIMGVTPAIAGSPRGTDPVGQTGWMPRAVNTGTTFNLIIAAGDTPSRALDNNYEWGDFNGGLQNLPRFLELWTFRGNPIPNSIQGSFIQQNRSAFSTAPYLPVLPVGFPANAGAQLASLFALSPPPLDPLAAPIPLPGSDPLTTYNIQGARIPYFTPPTRNWGFDVGLLSQPPDLFTQKFTTPATRTQPAEYFREVGRTDDWVTTLMCGVIDQTPARNATETLTPADRRDQCPT